MWAGLAPVNLNEGLKLSTQARSFLTIVAGCDLAAC
jgi:hypothetical protein